MATRDKRLDEEHGATVNLGNSVVSQLKLVHASQGSNTDVVTLVKDSNDDWKIDDIARISPLAIMKSSLPSRLFLSIC